MLLPAKKIFTALAMFLAAAGTAIAQDEKPPIAAPAITDDPATWPADVKTAYDEIRALPATARDSVKSSIFALAGKGRFARPAIAAIARQADLPEPHRGFGGVLLARFMRFDTLSLRKLAADANPFAQREAIVLIGILGGKENAAFLESLAKNAESESLKGHIERVAKTLPAESLPTRALELLDQIVNADAEAKKVAAAVLSEDFGKSAASSLQAIVKDLVSDDDARTFAALALVHVSSENVADLEALCARTNHKTLRYCAVRELAKKGAEGEAVLRKLAEDPAEPLKKNIEDLLKKLK